MLKENCAFLWNVRRGAFVFSIPYDICVRLTTCSWRLLVQMFCGDGVATAVDRRTPDVEQSPIPDSTPQGFRC